MTTLHSQADAGADGAEHAKPSSFWGLTLGSIGVVYGDIGTSPLYALRESLTHAAGPDGVFTRSEVIGIVSLLLWALIIVVTGKYILFLLRADNKGEGGTLSLMALAQRAAGGRVPILTLLGVIGASMFYGDAVITPAISVLSAVEGLEVVAPMLEPYVVGITLAILIGLFTVQRYGTASVAAWFGPITAVWFIVMGVIGAVHVADDLDIFYALLPHNGLGFLIEHGWLGFFVLGSVFLAVTGAEALYADLGHFGRGPIQTAWLSLVLPALALNYLGQGAMVLAKPETLSNPFFLLAPEWGRLPLVILATIATIVASQAVISGAFSLTKQAIQLGLLPRLEIKRTSETVAGQIYLPQMNALLLAGVVVLVVLFQTSSNLAAAYGLAVTTEMLMSTLLASVVVARLWGYGWGVAVAAITPLLVIEGAFFTANLVKIFDGGWAPVLIGAVIVTVMLTWRTGSRVLAQKTVADSVSFDEFLRSIERRPPQRVPGTAIFLTGEPDSAPGALLHNLKHNKVLHEQIVILTVKTADTPRVPNDQRIQIETLGADFKRLTISYGFMEEPNIPKGLKLAKRQGLAFEIMTTSFFIGRRTLVISPNSGMPFWQDKLFIWLARNAANVTDFFHIPPNRVVELGTQVSI